MKHSARDFAQAEFARHANGQKAMRREGVRTNSPWIYLVGNAIHRLSDQEMADEGWVAVGPEGVIVPNAAQVTVNGYTNSERPDEDIPIAWRIVGNGVSPIFAHGGLS